MERLMNPTKMRPALRLSLLVCLAVALCLPWIACAQDPPRLIDDLPTSETYHIQAVARYWGPSADIVVSSDAPGIPGTRIDLKNDLGLTTQRFPELQLVLRPALRHKVRLEYIPIHYQSTATPPRDIIFNGITYRLGLPATAILDWKAYRFGYEYDFLVKDRGFAGFIAEVKHTDVQVHVLSALADEVRRQEMPLPAIGGVVRVYPAAKISLTGEVTFFGVPDRPGGHYGGHYADLDVYGTLNFTHNIGAQVGFRQLDINHLGASDSATFTLKGIYVGAFIAR
jgi:hypothetical protein